MTLVYLDPWFDFISEKTELICRLYQCILLILNSTLFLSETYNAVFTLFWLKIWSPWSKKFRIHRICTPLRKVIYEISEKVDGADIREFCLKISDKKYQCKKYDCSHIFIKFHEKNHEISPPSDFFWNFIKYFLQYGL